MDQTTVNFFGRYVAIAIGLFLGNWLLAPYISSTSFRDGFYIGIIAAGLVMIFAICSYWMFP